VQEGALKDKWIARLAQVNKELLLIFSIVAFAAVVNLFVDGQRLVLTFYNLPTLFAVYYFGRRRAVQSAIATILFVVWVDVMHPTILSRSTLAADKILAWSDLTIWAGFLVIFAYATGTLYEHSQQRMHELRETYFGVLQILSQMISNDKFTQNHSYRVSVYATQIAIELGMREDQIEDVRAAALLHDVGKLEVSREVLYKAARLTDAEMQEIRTHVDRGVEMLSPVGGSLRRILPIILAHHDKFDGSGYHPTKGRDIPVEAVVISVADVYDSLVSDRPYRKGLSPFEARDTIIKASGTDFDPRIVNAFEAAFRKQRLEVPEVLV
jgi:putative nucleotidyltransferase with HDIG domain